jgi:hypothetical protein
MPYEKERQFYRMLIPPGDVATIQIGAATMPIRELSERGIRFDPVAGYQPEPGSRVSGMVHFKSVGKHPVSGTFVRMQGKSVVVVLDPPGIPYATLMQVQLFLRKRYPGR